METVKLLLLLVLATVPCLAQINVGSILGIVFDPSGAVIPGATVVVKNQGTSETWNLTTSARGDFIVPVVSVGLYTVTVSNPGFQTVVRRDVEVTVSAREQLTFTLKPGQQRQEVTVTAGAPVVNTASTTLGEVVGEREVQDLPTNGRDLSQLLELVPGVNLTGEGSIAGQSIFSGAGAAVNFLVDGTDANRVDFNFIDNTYGSSANRISRASIDDVQEFRVYENSFSAEFGDSLGGVVNIVTKSGTNQLHGDVYEYFRNEVLDARGYFDPVPQIQPPFRLNQFGGSAGGPIIKDKLFFYGGDETIRQRTGVSFTGQYVPIASYRATALPAVQPALAMLPLPNGPVSTTNSNLAEYSTQDSNVLNETAPSGKIDYLLSSTKRLDFRYNADKSLTDTYFGIAEGQIQQAAGFNQSARLSFTDNLSPTWLNETSVAFNRIHIDPRDSNLASVRAFPDTSITGMSGMGPDLFDLQVANNSFTFLDNASHVQGRQQMKFGLQILRNQDNKALNYEETETFTSVANFFQNRPQSVGTLGQPRAGLRNTYYGAFLQDDIQWSKKLTINAGVRYQFSTSPSEAHGRAVNFDSVTGNIAPLYSQILNAPAVDFAPRLGLAYAPFASRLTVFRASFGIFFPDINAAMAQNFPNNVSQEATSITNIQDPGLLGFPFPPISSYSATTTLSGIQTDWKNAYLQSWNFTVQQQLSENSRLQVVYVGNHTNHLPSPTENFNRFPAGSPKPYPAWGNIAVELPRAESTYDALQVSYNHRMAHGLIVNVNYTYSHALDDMPGGIFGSYQDDKNPMLDYGNADVNIRHQVEFDYVYSLPSVPHVPKVLGGGWQMNGITTMRGGEPYSISCSSCDPFSYGTNTTLANVVSGVPKSPASYTLSTGQKWVYNLPGFSQLAPLTTSSEINPDAWVGPPHGQWGNSGRNSVYGPTGFNFDFSLFKNFKITEHWTLKFQAEAFNIFNTPQFGNPVSTVGVSGFGTSIGTQGTVDGFGTNRQVQFALTLQF